MAKSIIQCINTYCFACGKNANFEPLDCHHVYGGPYRKKSEKYGLKVYLHHNSCHIFGAEAVHRNAKVDKELKAVVQERSMQHYGWSEDDFRAIFGKSYL
jgi:hypothetical protein